MVGCGTCKYWQMWPKLEVNVCKRFPPPVVAFPSDEPDLDGIRSTEFGPCYPPTDATDWCGEYKDRNSG